MGFIRELAILIILLAVFIFVVLFGSLPQLRKTPIGWFNRHLRSFPRVLVGIDHHVTGGRISRFLGHFGQYLLHENHPLVLIFFLSIVLGSEIIFLPAAFPRLSTTHRVLSIICSLIPLIFAYKCVVSKSSVVSAEKLPQLMSQYPYDHVLFFPGQICRTCQLLKPARSKHCRVCNVCVAKHDHHCIWVMNCLGKGNYLYFLLMVLSLGVLLIYGAWISYGLIDETIQLTLSRNEPGKHWSTGMIWSQRFHWFSEGLTFDPRIGSIGLLTTLTAPIAWGFLLYHVYLIWAGMTTNESSKWDDWKHDIADGFVYKLRDPPSVQKETSLLEPEINWPAMSNQKLVNRAIGQSINLEEHQDLDQAGWLRVYNISEIFNIYDLGFWDNLMDVCTVL